MTNKEAAEIILNYNTYGCGYCHEGGDEVPKAFEMAAKALLKAQEPVEPQEKREGNYRNLCCGACGRGVVGYVEHLTRKHVKLSDYCDKCGREVKWDDPN